MTPIQPNHPLAAPERDRPPARPNWNRSPSKDYNSPRKAPPDSAQSKIKEISSIGTSRIRNLSIEGMATAPSSLRAPPGLKAPSHYKEELNDADAKLIPFNIKISRARTLDAAFRAFNSIEASGRLQPNIISYNSLMSACAKSYNYIKALAVLDKMKANKIPRDEKTYAPLIRSCYDNAGNARQALTLMENDSVRPNDYIYNSLIQVYVNARDMSGAFSVAEEMKGAGIDFDVVTYTSLLNACCIRGDLNRALTLLEEMAQRSHINPNEKTYVSIIKACASCKNHPEAPKILNTIFNKIQNGKIKANVMLSTALINAFIEIDETKTAFIVFKYMEENGLAPDQVTYTALTKAHKKSFDSKSASSASQKTQVEEPEDTLTTLLHAYIQISDLGKARQTFHEMLEAGQKPGPIIFNALLHACNKLSNYRLGAAFFDEILEANLGPDEFSFTTGIYCHIKEGRLERAEELFHRMINAGLKPSDYTFCILMQGYSDARRPEKTEELFEQMINCDIKPNTVSFNTLIQAYLEAHDFKKGLECIDRMKTAGLKPLESTYSILIRGYLNANQPEKAKETFKNHIEIKTIIDKNVLYLDCHDLAHAAAYIQLIIFMENNPTLDFLPVITGKGMSSSKGKFQMRSFLLDRVPAGWDAAIDEQNEGVLLFRRQKKDAGDLSPSSKTA